MTCTFKFKHKMAPRANHTVYMWFSDSCSNIIIPLGNINLLNCGGRFICVELQSYYFLQM